MRILNWGNHLAVRLPSAVVNALKLKAGDEIEIEVAGERRLVVSRSAGAKALLAGLRKYRGRLPVGFRFDRQDAKARR